MSATSPPPQVQIHARSFDSRLSSYGKSVFRWLS